ncbi:MAG: DUF58 domain-containing protein [Halobacteriales archaeon]
MPSRPFRSPDTGGALARVPLTARGWVVLGAVVVGLVVGLWFGTPSIHAVVVPGAVALVVAAWQIRGLERPIVKRAAELEGTVGERLSVDLVLDDPPANLGTVADRVPDGLTASGNHRAVDLGTGLEYDLELDERGRYRLGPTLVEVQDLLGLARRAFVADGRTEVLVRPRVHPLRSGALARLATRSGVKVEPERHEFDRLREYRPTDSLRDVHWKSSARHPEVEFVVKEFVKESERGTVQLSGEAVDGGADALAEALASLAVGLADAEVRVGLATEAATFEPVANPEAVERLVAHLATIGPGVPRERGDLHLVAEGPELEAVAVEVGDERLELTDLVVVGDERRTRLVGTGPVPARGVAD